MINRGLPSTIQYFRKDMPQIKSKYFTDFLMWSQLSCHMNEPTDITQLRPTQLDINEKKVKEMIGRIQSGDPDFKGTITISYDGYVLDGHHRWLALLNSGITISPCNKIATGVNTAIEYMRRYPNAVRHDLNDSESISKR